MKEETRLLNRLREIYNQKGFTVTSPSKKKFSYIKMLLGMQEIYEDSKIEIAFLAFKKEEKC